MGCCASKPAVEDFVSIEQPGAVASAVAAQTASDTVKAAGSAVTGAEDVLPSKGTVRTGIAGAGTVRSKFLGPIYLRELL